MLDDEKIIFFIFMAIIMFAVGSTLLIFASLKTAIVGLLIFIFLVFSYKYPHLALWIFLIYLPFGGTVTYGIGNVFQADGGRVIYTAEYPLFHLIKDAFYLPALVSIVISTRKLQEVNLKYKPVILGCLFFAFACLLTFIFINITQELNPNNSEKSLLMGILGLKVLLGYIPLIICGYFLIRDKQDLFFLNRLQLSLIIVCCTLAFIQYILLIKGICPGNVNLADIAQDRATLQARCFVGGSLLYNPNLALIRLPGTFVAPWQWGWFLISASFFSYAGFMLEKSRAWQIISWIAIALVIILAILSGQRIAFILVPSILLLLLVITEQAKKWLPLKLGLIGFITFLVISSFELLQQRLDNFIGRWRYSAPPSFIITQFNWLLHDRLYLLGNGLGKATNSARRLGNTILIETWYPKLLYEVGIIGTITFFLLVTILTVVTLRVYQSLQTANFKRFALCLWVFILFISYNTYYYPLAVDPVAVYYWFYAGILLRLPKIE